MGRRTHRSSAAETHHPGRANQLDGLFFDAAPAIVIAVDEETSPGHRSTLSY